MKDKLLTIRVTQGELSQLYLLAGNIPLSKFVLAKAFGRPLPSKYESGLKKSPVLKRDDEIGDSF